VTDAPDLRTLSYDLSKNLGFQKLFKFEDVVITTPNPDPEFSFPANYDNPIPVIWENVTDIDTLNIFDAKVLYEALRVAYYLVLQEYEKILTVYSEWNQHFTSFWVGERSNQ
jgi:hypothetical protein